MTPLVSVILPVRNGDRFLPEALASLLAQDFPSLEIIAVDDGSSDATPAILAGFAGRDDRIRIVPGEGHGLAAALGIGIAAARGSLLARMDADDVARPDRIGRQFAELEDRPALAALGSSARLLDAAGTVRGRLSYPCDPGVIRARLRLGNCIIHPSVMMRREAVAAVGGYRAAYHGCEDYDLWLRLCARWDLANLDVDLLDYRLHDAQQTFDGIERRILAEIAAIEGAARREAGRPDLGDPAGGFKRSDLLAAGIPPRELSRSIARRAIAAARGALEIGHRQGAAAAHAVAAGERGIGARLFLRRAQVGLKLTSAAFRRRP